MMKEIEVELPCVSVRNYPGPSKEELKLLNPDYPEELDPNMVYYEKVQKGPRATHFLLQRLRNLAVFYGVDPTIKWYEDDKCLYLHGSFKPSIYPQES